MSKYHIRTDGSIGVCRAKEGKCPYTTHIIADSIEQAQMEADVLAYQNIKIERKQNKAITGGIYLDDLLDSDTADEIRASLNNKLSVDEISNIIRGQLKQKIGEQGYGADFLMNDSDTKTDDKKDLESLSTDELAGLLRGEMDDLNINLKRDIPELNKSLDINNYKQKG